MAKPENTIEVIEWVADENGEWTIDYSAYIWMANGDRYHVVLGTGEVLEYSPFDSDQLTDGELAEMFC